MILFNMKPMLQSLPYRKLNDINRFRNLMLEEKAICCLRKELCSLELKRGLEPVAAGCS